MNEDRLHEIESLAAQIQPLITKCLIALETDDCKIQVSTLTNQNDLSKPIIQPIIKDIINHWPRHIDYIGNLETLLPPLRDIDSILFPAEKFGDLVQDVSHGFIEVETRFKKPAFRAALIKELNL